MRVAHFGDLHLTRGPRLADQGATLNAMVDDILKASPDLVVVGGDLYGREVPHLSHPDERNALCAALARLGPVCPVLVLQGNHDDPRDIQVLSHLDTKWSVTVVTEPGWCRIVTPSGIVSCYSLPYPSRCSLDLGPSATDEDCDDAIAGLFAGWTYRIRKQRELDPSEPHIFLGHCAVRGAVLAGGEVLSGREVEVTRGALDRLPVEVGLLSHIHQRQVVAHRCSFAGSPWRTDFSETGEYKGWTLAVIGDGGNVQATDAYGSEGARQSCSVYTMPNACRSFVTLDYRWAPNPYGGDPAWTVRPSDADIEACKDAEVRMRLVVSESLVGGCPFDVEVARVSRLACRVVVEKKVEPVLRVRSVEVSEAVTPAAKLRAYWDTLATKPSPSETAAALDALANL